MDILFRISYYIQVKIKNNHLLTNLIEVDTQYDTVYDKMHTKNNKHAQRKAKRGK